jgi:diguanylate cyclase (GGDEF)-like protein
VDKRQSLRCETDIRAEAFGLGRHGRPCTIRNYCSGGLFVELEPAAQARDRSPRSQDRVEVRFSERNRPHPLSFRLPGEVIHVARNGFGLRFTRSDEAIRLALSAIREATRAGITTDPRPGRGAPAGPGASQLKDCLADFLEALEELSGEFFDQTSVSLDDAAQNADSLAVRQDHLRAGHLLQRSGQRIRRQWLEELRQRCGRLLGQARDQSASAVSRAEARDELQLVDKESFERWVVVSSLVSKCEADTHRQLYQLEQRFSFVAHQPVTGQRNPIGPSAVIWGLEKALEPIDLSAEAKRTVLQTLDERVLARLGELYASINHKLACAGVLEHLDYGPPTSRDGSAPEGSARPKGRRPVRKSGPRSALSVVKRVIGIGKQTRPSTDEPTEKTRDQPHAEGLPYEYQPEEVLGALSEIQGIKNRPLLDQVKTALARTAAQAGRDAALSPELTRGLEVVERLVDLFEHDERVPPLAREALNRLEVPLARAAVTEPDFLSDPDNAAVHVVDGLDRLATALSGEPPNAQRASEVREAIERIGTRLANDTRSAPEAFAQAKDALWPYVDEYERLFQANLQRVVGVCEGQERLKGASDAVREAIETRTGARPVPRVVNDTLRLGWASLLSLTWLDKGPGSPEWEGHLKTVADLLALFPAPPAGPAPATPLAGPTLAAIEEGLAQVAFAPLQQRKLAERLRLALTGEPSLWEKLRSDRVPLEVELPDPGTATPSGQETDPEVQSRLKAWLRPIRELSPGDWVVELRKPDPSRPVSLAWVNPAKDHYVFVDGRGFKAFERSLPGLASDLDNGRLSLLEDGRLPLIQRAVHRVLKTTYEQLVYDSAHDPLTGLANRRSFEMRLAGTLERARNDHSRHSVIILDLDRFQLINNLCGPQGGDRLLKEVANVARSYLYEGSLLARTGDDELGILIENCTRTDGFRVAQTQRRAIENLDFRWEGRRTSVTASFGLVSMDEHAESVSEVLKQAYEACFLAKKAGRNTVKVFESTDREVREHQKDVAAIARVESALSEGRLRLYAQLIEPVFLDEGLHDHYEILLRISDGAGEPTSAAELILTAERLDRMRVVDRWTIETVFAWLNEHSDRLSDIGGFSINLSGQSLTDPAMLELLLERLTETPFPTNRIAFEITETAMVQNIDEAREMVERLKEQGCQLFLDDFGTGMASYAYLKKFPVDCVKIDGSFIRNIATDDKDLALVRSITEIAHFSDRRVVAEHVETEAILVRLRELGIDFAQGFAIGRPVPLASLLNG